MPRFDADQALALVERHRVDWMYAVPTMMSRIWALPSEARDGHDLSSLRTVFHTPALCPEWLKRAWIDWLGPERIVELYGGTEGQLATLVTGVEWLDHPGTVGRPLVGEVQVRDPEGRPLPPGQTGAIWLRLPDPATPTSRYLGAEARATADG